jgi:hypothetical protein
MNGMVVKVAAAAAAWLLAGGIAQADSLTLGKLRSAYQADPQDALLKSVQYLNGSINTMDALVIDHALHILSITYDLTPEAAVNAAFDQCLDKMPNAEGMMKQIVGSEFKDDLPVTIAIVQQYKKTCRTWMP